MFRSSCATVMPESKQMTSRVFGCRGLRASGACGLKGYLGFRVDQKDIGTLSIQEIQAVNAFWHAGGLHKLRKKKCFLETCSAKQMNG